MRALVVVMIAFAGCGSSAAPNQRQNPSGLGPGGTGGSGGSQPSPSPASQPVGAYWSWRQVENWVISPLGGSSLTYDFEYVFRAFGSNGLVFTGNPVPDLGSKVCSRGEPSCEPFSVSNGMIAIGSSAPKPLVKTAKGWKIGSDSFEELPDYRGLTLSGTYEAMGRALASSELSAARGRTVVPAQRALGCSIVVGAPARAG